ncbi:MAG TPA: flagellar basal body protein, partial [Bacillota bacterium]|nr:flagellar basal body protein [Bacillota bacterium]
MIDALFSQPNYVAAKKMLDATVLRQEAIASNLANLETPNYRRLDVSSSFSTQLKQAMASANPTQIASVQPHLEPDNTQDGNTVQLESELIALNKNYL